MTKSYHGRSTRADTRGKTERPRKPSKIQPILLDRLSHALAAHGVSLKRTEVLQVAASAFGYHNANEFSAADLVVQPAKPVAQATLPDGDRMIVVRDPIANTAYGVEMGFIEQIVAEERREQFGVSPYGHLLDLSGLLDIDLDALGSARPPAGATLHIAVCEHKHGTSGWVGLTKADLYRQIAGFCTEYWREVERDAGPIDEYDGDEAIVRGYFDGHDSETLYVEEAKLPAAPPAPSRQGPPAGRRPQDGTHPRYPYEDYRNFMFVTGRTLTYEDWVAQRAETDAARDASELWLDVAGTHALKPGTVVRHDLYALTESGTHLRPGMLARITSVHEADGAVTADLAFGDGSKISYTDRTRAGLFPFYVARSDSTSGGAVESLDWICATAALNIRIGSTLKLGIPMRANGTTIPAGRKVELVSRENIGGHLVQLRVSYLDQVFTLTERLPTGIFPLRVVAPAEIIAGRTADPRWLDRDGINHLDIGECVMITRDILTGPNRRCTVPEGELAEVHRIGPVGDRLRIELILDDDGKLTLTDADYDGLFPVRRLACRTLDGRPVTGVNWITARTVAKMVAGGGFRVAASFTVPGADTPVTLHEGTVLKMVSSYAKGGDRVLNLETLEGTAFSLAEPVENGVFPILLGPGSTVVSTLHTRQDWSEALAQGATDLPYWAWAHLREAKDIHLTEGWLTEDQILHGEEIGLGEELVIRIHGSLRGYDQERNAYGDTVFKPGDTVYLHAVDDHYNATGLLITVRTRSGLTFDLETRDGYFPVSLVHTDADADGESDTTLENGVDVTVSIDKAEPGPVATGPDQSAILSKKTHLVEGQVLTSGTLVERDGGEPVMTLGIADVQPLQAEGLLLFTDADDIVHLARYDGGWKLLPPSAMTHDHLRLLGRPDFEEEIVFPGVDCHIEAHDFPPQQPLAASGIVIFVDQYRETHMCARTGPYWEIVQRHDLTPAQAKVVEGLI